METTEYNENKQRLLAVLQSFAPTGKEQEMCSKLLRDYETEVTSQRLVLQLLTGVLYDGLAYGNWFWTY